MKTPHKLLMAFAAAVITVTTLASIAAAQQFITKQPTSEDWAALAKLPDFNGVWERGGGGGGGGGGAAAPRGNAAPNADGQGARSGGAARGAAPRGGQGAGQGGGAAAGAPRGGQGAGAAAGAPRGGGGRGGGMQLTAEYEAKRRAYQANPPEDNETANCLPPGMPGIMTQPYPMEFLLTPGKVTIVIEAYTQVRHIYTDGRKLPDEPNPKFFGTSVGRWEGDTLVAESVGFSPIISLTGGVHPSDKMRIVERFRLSGPDTMTIETTITDPVVLAAPYTTTNTLRRHREWTITEYICEENNRNSVDSTGKAGIDLSVPATISPK
jgi:hypothetical protein